MFKVTRQPTITSEPPKRALHDPPMRQDLKAVPIIRPSDDVEHPAKLLVNRFNDRGIGAIGPNQFQPTPAVVNCPFDPVEQALQGLLSARPILETGAMHQDDQQQAQRIDPDMPFTAWRLFVHIYAAGFAPLPMS